MNKSKELKNTTAIVKEILEHDERARNSDSFLYFKVIGRVGHENGIDITFVSVAAFLLNMSEWGFPAFETVRRTRQKIQQHNPELAGNGKIEAYRAMNEEVFRDYARKDVV